jgi:hypothetical protein
MLVNGLADSAAVIKAITPVNFIESDILLKSFGLKPVINFDKMVVFPDSKNSSTVEFSNFLVA